MKEQGNHWRRQLTPNQKKYLKKEFEDILKVSRGGILTTKQRQRLLGLKKQTKDYDERKFWSDIRNSVKTTFVDLQIIMQVASDKQLTEMFESYFSQTKDKRIKHSRMEMMKFLDLLLREFDDKSQKEWQYDLGKELVEKGIYYFRSKKEFQGTLYQRLFEDMIDSLYIHNPRDSNLSGMA